MNRQIAAQPQQAELVCKSSQVFSERRGATYREQDEINIYIPPSMALINCKNTFLQCRVKMSGNLKICPSGVAGCYSMFRDVTVQDGTGQYTLEQLQNYGEFDGVRQFYSENESLKNIRVLHEGKPSSLVIGNTVCNQYIDPAEHSEANVFKEVEVLLPLHNSGCLSPDRDTTFPNLATNGLRIRLNLNDAQTATNVITAPLYDTEGIEVEEGTITSNGNFKAKGGGGYTAANGYELQAAAAQGAVTLVLKKIGDTLGTDNRVLSPNNATPAHLFMVGQTIRLNDAENVTISNVTVDGNNRINLTVSAVAAAAGYNIGDSVHIVVDATTASNSNFAISDVKMVVGSVVPPQGYVEDILAQIGSGKLQLDIRTYQNYPVNIANNSLNNSLYLNARNNRAKSILSVPFKATGNDFVEDSMVPDRATIRDYQFVLYKILTPDKLVDCNRFNLEAFNGIALREQMHALGAADIPVNNILKNYEHFFIGRRLAMKNYSYNMNKPDMGEVRLNVNYSEMEGVLMNNFVVNLRRLIIRPQGIDIIY